MSDPVFYIIVLAIVAIAVVMTYMFSKLKFEKKVSAMEERIASLTNEKTEKDKGIEHLEQQLEQLREEMQQLHMDIVKKESALEHADEKLKRQQEDVAKLQEKFSKDFEILASKILEDKSSKFTEKNRENMEQILNPLQEKIKSFEKKVEDTHKESIEKQSALRQQILGLKDLNEQMSKDAVNLTRALKGDSKKQGDWGELQLETILEKAGLQKDVHFSTQDGYRDEQERLKKPDLIINLPDNKHLIIDSKVSLTGYERFFSAENENVIITAIKKCEDDSGVIVRWYETEGSETHAKIHSYFKISEASQTNIIEVPEKTLSPVSNSVALKTQAFGIETLKLIINLP